MLMNSASKVQLVVLHDFATSSDEEIGALALAAERGHAPAIEEMQKFRNPANLKVKMQKRCKLKSPMPSNSLR